MGGNAPEYFAEYSLDALHIECTVQRNRFAHRGTFQNCQRLVTCTPLASWQEVAQLLSDLEVREFKSPMHSQVLFKHAKLDQLWCDWITHQMQAYVTGQPS